MAPRNNELKAFREEMRAVTGEIKADLKEHMARTDALERFQARWSGAFIAFTALATLAGIAASVVKVWQAFR